jgi:hypothetical protein
MAPIVTVYWQIAVTFLLTFLTYIVLKGWHSRRLFYKLRRQGMVRLKLYLVRLKYLTLESPCHLGTL